MSFFSDALRRVGGALGLPVAEVEALVDDAVARAEDIVRATGSRVAGRIIDAVEAAVPGIPVEEIAGDVSDTIASEVDGAVPDVDTLVLAEVERWRLWHGNESLALGEVFALSPHAQEELVFEGDLSRADRIGWQLAGGVIDTLGTSVLSSFTISCVRSVPGVFLMTAPRCSSRATFFFAMAAVTAASSFASICSST